MLRLCKVTVVLLTALHLLGGHWGILQTVAWAQMLKDYSQSKSMVQAVKETFDGEHPCPMCLKIKEGRQKEQQEQSALPQLKQDSSAVWFAFQPMLDLPALVWRHSATTLHFTAYRSDSAQWASVPATPPPRCGMA